MDYIRGVSRDQVMLFPDSVEEILEQDIFQHLQEAPPKTPPPLVADVPTPRCPPRGRA